MKPKTQFPLLLFFAICLLSLSFHGCNSPRDESGGSKNDTLKGKITISGAFALYPMTVRWAEEFQKIHRRVKINVSAGGAGKGMADALSKMVDLAMYSKEVSPEEQAKGAWWLAVAKDAVLPTINQENPVLKEIKLKGISRSTFNDIFIIGKVKTWGQITGTKSSEEVVVFTRSDACGAADMWAKYLSGKKQEDLQGLGVNGDPGVADAVRKTVGGIGYNNLNFTYDLSTRKPFSGIAVVPIDLNNNGKIDPDEDFYATLDEIMKAINDGKYPSPPARDLYLVTKGKPSNKLVLAFLEWILTDGQKYVPEAGYIVISPEKIKADLDKLR
jgi:phosphate transport system substrate-binding protein